MNTKERILNGVNLLADTVKLTLGTKGRTVLFNDENNKPHITKDGVTVAHHIHSDDDYENMVITVLREASMKTMLSSGDGTTSTVILAQYLINNGLDLLDEGISYYELSKQLDIALADVIEYIKDESISIETKQSLLKEIAAISSNDPKVGDFIYSIIEDIGLYGDIEVRATKYSETSVDKTKGMKLHKGWFENFMVSNNRTMTFEAINCNVLIFDDSIQSMPDFVDYVEHLMGEPLVIFCDDISDITLTQIEKWMKGTGYPICFVENDGFGERKQILMNDLAALTGGWIVDSDSEFDPRNLGKAGSIKVNESSTSILDGEMDKDLVDEIVEDIKLRLDHNYEEDELNLSNVDKKFHQKRLANLTGGVAVISVGGRTEMEMKELKDRLDDAVLAVSSSIRQGVNVGGGYTYLNCQKKLKNKCKDRGYQLLIDTLDSPFKQLLTNADLATEYDKHKKKILNGFALDLRNNKLYKTDDSTYTVYDPTSVLTDSISNAVAVAKSILSVRNLIYDGKVLR